nr:hypothetical protein [Tanacetum cinerariifolium]
MTRSAATPRPLSKGSCFNFAIGSCRFGSNCRYVYDENAKHNASTIPRQSSNTTDALLAKILDKLGLHESGTSRNSNSSLTNIQHVAYTATIPTPMYFPNQPDHTFDWLRVVSIYGLGQTMNGVFTGDIYGHHVVSCADIIGIEHRHNVVCDTLVNICFWSGISASKEVDIGLGGGLDKPLRPTDMLRYPWDGGLDVCVDLTGYSPLMQPGLTDFLAGHAVVDAAHPKRVKYEAKCADTEYGFLPFSFYSFGELEKDAMNLLKRIRKFFVTQDIRAHAAVHIFNRISFAIAKGVGAQLVSQPHTNFLLPILLRGLETREPEMNSILGKKGSGYMAPEYAMEGLFSTKSDVYSFGVLLLEIVAGQRNNRFSYQEQPQNFLSTGKRKVICKQIIPLPLGKLDGNVTVYRLHSASLQTKLLRHSGIVASGRTFDDALCVFYAKMKTDLLNNPNLWQSQMKDHTSDWLRVVLISGLGQTMNGVFTGDIYGDHVVSCADIIGIKHRHNVVCDTLVDICFRSGISASKEVDIRLGGGLDKPLRPSDILSYSWDGGLDVCVDLTGSSPLTQPGLTDFLAGHDAINLLKRIRKFSVTQDIGAHAAVHIFNRINFAIAKGVRAQLVSRPHTNFL